MKIALVAKTTANKPYTIAKSDGSIAALLLGTALMRLTINASHKSITAVMNIFGLELNFTQKYSLI